MMRYSHTFVLLLTLSFAFSSEGIRLRRTGGPDVASDTNPDVGEPSRVQEETLEQDEQDLQDTDRFISSSEEDNAGAEEQEDQDADGSVSSVEQEEEEVWQEESYELDAEESSSENSERAEEAEQDVWESSFASEEDVWLPATGSSAIERISNESKMKRKAQQSKRTRNSRHGKGSGDLNQGADQAERMLGNILQQFGTHELNTESEAQFTTTVANHMMNEGYNVMVIHAVQAFAGYPPDLVRMRTVRVKHCRVNLPWADNCIRDYKIFVAPRGVKWSVSNIGAGGYENWAFGGRWDRVGNQVMFH
jgi:hypothetical protein